MSTSEALSKPETIEKNSEFAHRPMAALRIPNNHLGPLGRVCLKLNGIFPYTVYAQ